MISGLSWRSVREDDHASVLAAVGDWWDGGRGAELGSLLPRLFFQHFCSTSIIVHHGEVLVGFLVGFFSPTDRDCAYVHFIGVGPSWQGTGLGRALYKRFIDLAQEDGRSTVHAVTGVANVRSQDFHRHLGFVLSSPRADYDGPGLDRVTMVLRLGSACDDSVC